MCASTQRGSKLTIYNSNGLFKVILRQCGGSNVNIVDTIQEEFTAGESYMQARSLTLVVPGILDKVFPEDPHENGSQETRQQQHRHTGVDDAEPVDLHAHMLIRGCVRLARTSAEQMDLHAHKLIRGIRLGRLSRESTVSVLHAAYVHMLSGIACMQPCQSTYAHLMLYVACTHACRCVGTRQVSATQA